jgi:hypothetical protein
MYTDTPTGHESTVTTEHSFTQILQSYTSVVNDLLAESDVTDDDDMAALKGLSSQLIDEATDIKTQVQVNEEAVHKAQELVADTRRQQADVRGDVHELTEAVESDDDDVESISDASTPTDGGDGANQRTEAPVTALGDCIALPETVADQELTANIKRARDVAGGRGRHRLRRVVEQRPVRGGCRYRHQTVAVRHLL